MLTEGSKSSVSPSSTKELFKTNQGETEKPKIFNKIEKPAPQEAVPSTSSGSKTSITSTNSNEAVPSSSRASAQEDSDEQEMLRRRRLEKFTREPSVD